MDLILKKRTAYKEYMLIVSSNMDAKRYYEEKDGIIKRVKVDRTLIRSLVEMANITENIVQTAEIDKVNISVYVSLAYNALSEVLDAVCISRGYQTKSHSAKGVLMKDLINGDFDYGEFDRLRCIRNRINYYGSKVDYGVGIEAIYKALTAKEKIISKYLKSFKSKLNRPVKQLRTIAT